MGAWYFPLLTMIAPIVGAFLQQRDTNTTGADDAFGRALVLSGPILEGLAQGDEKKARKGIKAVRDALDTYLKATEPVQP